MKGAAALIPAVVAMLSIGGCDSEQAQAREGFDPRRGNVVLGEESFPFTVTTCLRGGQAPAEFVILGGGTAPDGRRFDIQADGRRGRVEVRIKGEAGAAEAIYTSLFAPDALRLDQNQVLAQGQFQRIAQGGRIDGRFQAGCP